MEDASGMEQTRLGILEIVYYRLGKSAIPIHRRMIDLHRQMAVFRSSSGNLLSLFEVQGSASFPALP